MSVTATHLKRSAGFLLAIAVLVALDQATKRWSASSTVVPIAVRSHWGFAAAVWALLLVRCVSRIDRATVVELGAFALLLAGGLSNLIERRLLGFAVNPFHLHTTTPVSFSLGDTFVLGGGMAVCTVLLFGILRRSGRYFANRSTFARQSSR
jgi:lipoprotein signal peptidase